MSQTTEICRVLVIEDDEDDFFLTRETLEAIKGATYRAHWASSYEEGLKALRQCGHDMCLLDYSLGGRSGLDLLREADAEMCTAPVILLTGYEDYRVDVEATAAGAADYLLKTHINALILERSIRYAIGRKRTEGILRQRAQQQNLIAAISTQLANAPIAQIEAEIQHILGDVGRFCQAERSYILVIKGDLENSQSQPSVSNSHEWCAPDVPHQQSEKQDLLLAQIPWVARHLRRMEDIAIASVDEMPDEAKAEREKFQSEGVSAAVLVPMGYEGRAVGFIGCDMVEKPRQWDKEVLAFLRIVGELIAGAVERAHTVAALESAARQNNLLATAIDNLASSVIISDPHLPDNPLIFANPAFNKVTGYQLDEVLGKNCRFLRGPGTDAEQNARLREAIEAAREYRGTLLNYRKDGTPFWNELVVSPVFDAQGQLTNFIGLQTDVTEQVENQNAVRQREEHFRALIENASDIVCVTDGAGLCLYASPSLERILGYQPAQAVGHDIFKIVESDGDANLRERLHGRREEGQKRLFLHRCRHANGSWRWLESSARDERRNPAVGGIIINSRDVTERLAVEDALKESETRFARMVANVPGMIFQFVQRPDGTQFFPYISQGGFEICGYTAQEIQNDISLIFRCLHPDDRLIFEQAIRQSSQNLVPFEWEGRLQHRDGHWLWARSVSRPNQLPDGSIVWDGLMTDISAEKQADAELRASREQLQHAFDELEERVRERTTDLQAANDSLRQSEERYRSLAYNFPNGALFLFDRDLRFQIVGGRALEQLGYTPQRLEGKTIWEGLPPELVPVLEPIYREILRGETPTFDIERQGRTFSVHTFPVRNESGEIYAGMVAALDITSRKRAEEALQNATLEAQAARESAESANRANSEFLSRMSHELRTPLNSILGFGQLLQRSDLSAKQKKRTDLIVTAGRHLLDLINEVLDIARIEAGRLDLSTEPMRAAEAIQEAVSLARPLAQRRNIALEVQTCGDDLFLLGDRQRVRQVLLNLVSNALKYNYDGGWVRVQCLQTERDVCIAVSDGGPGIEPGFEERLFAPFERLGAERSDIEGTGLGLALSQRLVIEMGGRIEVQSEPGVGSTFTLRLPVGQAPHALNGSTGPLERKYQTEQGARKILYIEDNTANIQLVESIFSELLPSRLIVSMLGGLGIELAREHRPDLVLLDLHLPDIDGIEVLRRLKRDPALQAIPVIILSADATPSQIEQLYEAGAQTYLTKPLDVEEFLNAVNEIFRASQSGSL